MNTAFRLVHGQITSQIRIMNHFSSNESSVFDGRIIIRITKSGDLAMHYFRYFADLEFGERPLPALSRHERHIKIKRAAFLALAARIRQ